MKLSILIPTHNRSVILARTLESLTGLILPPDGAVELIVVASACTDDTREVVGKWRTQLPFPSRCVIENQVGANVARNTAVQAAQGDVVLYLDDDVCVDPSWLVSMVDAFDRHPDAGMIGGRVRLWWEAVAEPPSLTPTIRGLLSEKDHGDQEKQLLGAGDAISANLAIRRELFATVGPFNPNLGRCGQKLMGSDETEWLDRALGRGIKMYYAPRAEVKTWVAPHRMTLRYLTGVAYGNGYSRVMAKHTYGPKAIGRGIVGHTFLVGKGLCGWALAVVRGRRMQGVEHRCLAATGWGGLRGILDRVAMRRPSKPEVAPGPRIGDQTRSLL